MAITCIPSSGVTIIISFDRVRRRKVIKSSVGSKSRTVSRALLAQKSNFELMRNVTLLSSDVYWSCPCSSVNIIPSTVGFFNRRFIVAKSVGNKSMIKKKQSITEESDGF